MTANELRVGNKVLCNKFLSHNTDTGTKYELVETIVTVENIKDCKHFEPIPLTEQWLLRFGFAENKHTIGCFGNNVIGIYFRNGEGNYNIAKFKYVHQLQNLYFALTGEELPVTP